MSDETALLEEPSLKKCAFFKLIEERLPKRVAIFSHPFPDPDAIGSMMGVEWLLNKMGIECECFYDGKISHPQNSAMVNLLEPNLKTIDEYNSTEYDFVVLVDTVPSYAGISDKNVNFDLVIDHHKEVPNGGFKGLFLNFKAGSCSGTVYNLIKRSDFNFEEDNDLDSRVATALMVGITTDTENLMSDDTTNYEFEGWSDLFQFRDAGSLKNIIHYQKPRVWTDIKAEAVNRVEIIDGVGVVGLGIISERHRDMISDMSSEMVTWEDIKTAIAFAIIDGCRIEGSVRSTNASINVSDLCKRLGGKHGSGGGKLGKGAYHYDLAGGSCEEDDDEEIKKQIWDTFDKKETKRIFRVLKK